MLFCHDAQITWLHWRDGYKPVKDPAELCLFRLLVNVYGQRHISRCHFQYLGPLIRLTPTATTVGKHVNINILWPNKDAPLTSIIPYDGGRKSPLIHLCQETSRAVDGIRSKANVKLVYPPPADRSAWIHHKHSSLRWPSCRISAIAWLNGH